MTRAEKVARAQYLRDCGLLLREIADEMGVGLTSVGDWLSDPEGRKLRERHRRFNERHGGTCEDCGKPTTCHRKDEPSRWCQACDRRRREFWTKDLIVEAVHAWAQAYGRPPSAGHWRPGAHNFDEDRYYSGPVIAPSATTVQNAFGSWSAALHAAGFNSRTGYYGREGERPEFRAEIVRRYRAGESSTGIARSLGRSDTSVRHILKGEGVECRSLSEAMLLAWSKKRAAA